MENPTLHAYLKSKGLISDPPVIKNVNKKKSLVEINPVIVQPFPITLNKIIETKPSRKTVIKYLQHKIEEREKLEMD